MTMQLKVKNRILRLYDNLSVTLRYDNIADTFSFQYHFQPWDKDMRELFLPGSYHNATVTHKGETLITGVVLNSSSSSGANKTLRSIGGYSRSGALEDCTYVTDSANQLSNNTLKEIVEELCRPFCLQVIVDDAVKEVCDRQIPDAVIKPDQKIRDFLSSLCCQRNVVLSHNENGDVLLTRANTKQKPIWHFNEMPVKPEDNEKEAKQRALEISLNFDGQKMHSVVHCVAENANTNAGDDRVRNPYFKEPVAVVVPGYRPFAMGVYDPTYRPTTEIQTAGDDVLTGKTARYYLGQELKAITLTIKMHGWTLNGKLVRPNRIVSVTSPENSIYQATNFFIESVNYTLDPESKAEVATLICVLPEVYNEEVPGNIFTGKNLHVPVPASIVERNAHAVITPFIEPEDSSVIR